MKTLPPPINATIKEALAYLHLKKIEQLRALEARGVLRIIAYNARCLRIPWDDLHQVNDRLAELGKAEQETTRRRPVVSSSQTYADAVAIWGYVPGKRMVAP